jgi:hypothetical protein
MARVPTSAIGGLIYHVLNRADARRGWAGHRDIQGMRVEIALASLPGTSDNAPMLGSQELLRQSQEKHD